MKTQFADDWITTGWGKINGQWIELGHSASVTINPPPLPPQLAIHDIADKLNELESAALKEDQVSASTSRRSPR